MLSKMLHVNQLYSASSHALSFFHSFSSTSLKLLTSRGEFIHRVSFGYLILGSIYHSNGQSFAFLCSFSQQISYSSPTHSISFCF